MKRWLIGLLVACFALSMFGSGQLEIFSWWTGGGEEEGLLALIELFNEQYPDVRVINATVAGGAGVNAKAVLKTRMLGNNPPDSFQVHAGEELTDTYVITGYMEPITQHLKDWGVYDKFPPSIMEICSYKGEVYSIPVNVHRGNVVFYNMAIAKEIGMTSAPRSMDEFRYYLQKAKDKGYIGLSLGDKDKWEAGHLFETLLLSTYGPDRYNKLWDGSQSFDHYALRKAFERLASLVPFFNSDHAALTWQDASRLVYEKRAFANIMGDWAEGYFKTMGWEPGVDFGWFAVPETQDTFMVVSDTFGLPKNAPNRENALRWLQFIASVEAQDTFNPIKGSIPARMDADYSKYDVYLQWCLDDFATLALSPSIAHGSAAPEGFATAMNDVVNRFITTLNVDQAIQGIFFAAEDEDYTIN